MPKCIILDNVRDKDTLRLYKPLKDENGNDIAQEVSQAFYDRAIKTRYIKAIESNEADEIPEGAELQESEIDTIEGVDEIPEGAEVQENITIIPDLEEKTVEELKVIAEEKGIELKSSMKKAEIIEAIRKELYEHE